MRLIICDSTSYSMDNICYIDAALLREPGVHLFIASHHWEEIVINDIDALPDMKVSVMHKVADKITVGIPETLTENAMRKLTMLFPEKAGSIRRCYMTHGDIKEVLQNCSLSVK